MRCFAAGLGPIEPRSTDSSGQLLWGCHPADRTTARLKPDPGWAKVVVVSSNSTTTTAVQRAVQALLDGDAERALRAGPLPANDRRR